MRKDTISTITPVYNGAKYLPNLVLELEKVRNEIAVTFPCLEIIESIFVIDECIDNSAEILYAIKKEKKWVKVIELSKNFGQHPATIAGILYSSGDWVVTMDEDLQHHPKYIVHLLKRLLEKSSDVCYANSKKGAHNSFIRDKLSLFYKKMVGYITGNKHIEQFNSFRIIRGNIARAASSIANYNSYFDIVLGWFTNRITNTEVELNDERNKSGEQSGYSILSLIRHGKRMVMTSKIKLTRGVLVFGLLAFLMSIGLIIYTIVNRIFNPEIEFITTWFSLMSANLFFGGLLSLLLGFTLESVTDNLIHSKGKPIYFVVDRSNDRELLNHLEAKSNH